MTVFENLIKFLDRQILNTLISTDPVQIENSHRLIELIGRELDFTK